MHFTAGGFARRVAENLEHPRSVDTDLAVAQSPAVRDSTQGKRSAAATVTPPPPRELPAVAHVYWRLHSLLHRADVRVSDGDVVFIVASYDVMLRREPDDPGFLSYARHLARGGTRMAVLFAILRSAEYRDRCGSHKVFALRLLTTFRRVREATRDHWILYVHALAYAAHERPNFPEWRFDSMDRALAELRARQFELAALVRETLPARAPFDRNGAHRGSR